MKTEVEATKRALTKVRATPPKQMCVLIFGSREYVLPYNNALHVMENLEQAEELIGKYNGRNIFAFANIGPIAQEDNPAIRRMDRSEYERLKMSALLRTEIEE